MKNRILVTGGTGYIGSHTVVELINAQYEVVIIDDLSNSYASVIDNILKITGKKPAFEQFNLCDKKLLDQFFKKYTDISAIIHFAASKSVNESVEKPLKYYRNNLMSCINLLDAMREYSVPYMVFSSSCTVYGQPEKLPVTEYAPLQTPSSPYGNTKQICEKIIQDVTISNEDISAISLRYFNPIGAHTSSLIGELSTGTPDNLVPYITQTGIGIREFLRVFGNDYDTPDGTCIRDFIHVIDIADVHIKAVERLLGNKNKAQYEFFNVGTGRGYSVMEVIKTFEKVSGKKLNYKILGRRPGDIEKIWADTSLANKELEWVATRDLDEMLLTAWNWEKHYRPVNI
ncbi:MAG: UDP-glucose 4-epimerase GalE [Desulfobacterales bacterium]|nr:UDP-glucose 4-epimerase GalE [Desulfobacterales bacterium]